MYKLFPAERLINKSTSKLLTYLISDGVNKGLPFIIFGFLALVLSPEELGLYSSKIIIYSFFNALIGLGLNSQLVVSIKKNNESKSSVVTALHIIYTINFLTLMLLGYVAHVMGFSVEKYELFYIILASYSFTIIQIKMTIFQAEYRAKSFGALNLLLSTSMAGVVYLCVVLNGNQNEIWMYISLIYSVLAATVAWLILKNNLNIEQCKIKKYFKLGLFQMPHLLSNWVKLGFDRIVILKYMGSVNVGIYSLYLQFGLVVSAVLQSFNRYWSVYFISMLAEGSDKKQITKEVMIFCALSVFTALSVSAVAFYIITNFLSVIYREHAYVVIIICMSYALQGCYFSLVNMIFYIEKTHLLNFASISSSLFHMAFTMIVIGHFKAGYEYAAYSLLISWMITLLITYVVIVKSEHEIYKKK